MVTKHDLVNLPFMLDLTFYFIKWPLDRTNTSVDMEEYTDKHDKKQRYVHVMEHRFTTIQKNDNIFFVLDGVGISHDKKPMGLVFVVAKRTLKDKHNTTDGLLVTSYGLFRFKNAPTKDDFEKLFKKREDPYTEPDEWGVAREDMEVESEEPFPNLDIPVKATIEDIELFQSFAEQRGRERMDFLLELHKRIGQKKFRIRDFNKTPEFTYTMFCEWHYTIARSGNDIAVFSELKEEDFDVFYEPTTSISLNMGDEELIIRINMAIRNMAEDKWTQDKYKDLYMKVKIHALNRDSTVDVPLKQYCFSDPGIWPGMSVGFKSNWAILLGPRYRKDVVVT